MRLLRDSIDKHHAGIFYVSHVAYNVVCLLCRMASPLTSPLGAFAAGNKARDKEDIRILVKCLRANKFIFRAEDSSLEVDEQCQKWEDVLGDFMLSVNRLRKPILAKATVMACRGVSPDDANKFAMNAMNCVTWQQYGFCFLNGCFCVSVCHCKLYSFF